MNRASNCNPVLLIHGITDDVEMLGRLNLTVMWTPYELIIVPAESSLLPVGKEVIVPARLHFWMLTDERCHQAVAAALSEPVLATTR